MQQFWQAIHREVPEAGTYLAEAVAKAGRVPGGAKDPIDTWSVMVVGAGAMGRGIALGFAMAGRPVRLVDPSAESRAAAKTYIDGRIARDFAKGRLTALEAKRLTARLSYHGRIDASPDVDIAIEAVPEVLDLKQKVLSEMEAVLGPNAYLTSNTSTLDVDQIARVLTHPARFIGTHFFMPAETNPLLELVPARATDPGTTAAILALAKDLKKRAVIAPNGDGFIGNRLFDRFHQEAMYLVEEGAYPQEVDQALEAFGFRIGPFRALDMVGNDIPWGVRVQRAARANPPHQPRVGDALCEAGLMGQKTGRGWYLYDAASPKGRPYEEAQALILRVGRELGLTRRRIEAGEVVTRCLLALAIEGRAMLAEGRAQAASDIDMVQVTGYGFPPDKAGPMKLTEGFTDGDLCSLAAEIGALSGRADTAWAWPKSLETQSERTEA